MQIDVPPAFAHGTVLREGEAGAVFVADLPATVARLAGRWRLTQDGPVAHGTVGVVVPVRRPDGTRAALKVSWPDEETRHEEEALGTPHCGRPRGCWCGCTRRGSRVRETSRSWSTGRGTPRTASRYGDALRLPRRTGPLPTSTRH